MCTWVEEQTRTIFCDEFREIFKIDKPCCASCHDEYEDDLELGTSYSVIGSDYEVIQLPSGEYVKAQLCCAMIHTPELEKATREGLYGTI